MKKEFILYMHDQCEEPEEIYDDVWPYLSDEAKRYFSPGYEVPIVCEVDRLTGECFAIGLKKGDRTIPLAEPVKV